VKLIKRILEFLQRVVKKYLAFFSLSWTVLIFIGCSLPGRDIPKMGLFENVDKVVHFIFFAIFYLLWFLFFSNKNYSFKGIALYIFLISIVYGFGLEFYQKHCVAGRSFDVWDGVADTLGACLVLKKVYTFC